MSPTYRLLSVTCDPTICAGTWVSVTYRLLSVTCDPTIFLQASEYYLCAGSWVLPRILLFIQAHECTYVQILECHLRFHYLYRHLNVTYIQALEYYLRSHYLYTHLSLTYTRRLSALFIQATGWRFTPPHYTGARVSFYSKYYRRVWGGNTMKTLLLRLPHEILLYSFFSVLGQGPGMCSYAETGEKYIWLIQWNTTILSANKRFTMKGWNLVVIIIIIINP